MKKHKNRLPSLFLALTIGLLLVVVGACQQSSTQSKSSAPQKAKINGQEVFNTYCKICHGVKGNLGSSGAFDLTTSRLSKAERIQVITHGRNTMTPFEEVLSKEEIDAVAEYIVTLRK